MSKEPKHIEAQSIVPVRRDGGVAAAALIFHAGRSHVVAHRSEAERELLERGALHVGMVRFDGSAAASRPPRRLELAPASVGAWGSSRN